LNGTWLIQDKPRGGERVAQHDACADDNVDRPSGAVATPGVPV
jgi:hypothetical protein